MLNLLASLAMSTNVLEALPGKLDIKRHSPSILYLYIMPYYFNFISLSLIFYEMSHDVNPVSLTNILLRNPIRLIPAYLTCLPDERII